MELASLSGRKSWLVGFPTQAAARGIEFFDRQREIPVIPIAPLGSDRGFAGFDRDLGDRGIERRCDGFGCFRSGGSQGK